MRENAYGRLSLARTVFVAVLLYALVMLCSMVVVLVVNSWLKTMLLQVLFSIPFYLIVHFGFFLRFGYKIGCKSVDSEIKQAVIGGLALSVVLTILSIVVSAVAWHGRMMPHSHLLLRYSLWACYMLLLIGLEVAFSGVGGWLASRRLPLRR